MSVHGNRNKIDLSLSNFKDFIESNSFYIDKTCFIENFLTESNSVVMITRPRRTGKTLNLDMLKTFLDCRLNSKKLFDNLYIANSDVMEEINQYPVIHLDFKYLRFESYKSQLKRMIQRLSNYYLNDSITRKTLEPYWNNDKMDTNILYYFCEAIFDKYEVKPFILIDEYDKILMDNIHSENYNEIKLFFTELFESALKGNNYLKKAVLTGVSRVSKEGLLSGLNNLVVYDIFTPSKYDTDFSLSEDEAKQVLLPKQLSLVKDWYNNIRVGNAKLYNIYSVMSYLHFGTLNNYWGRSGTINLLIELLNKKRADALAHIISDMSQSISTRLEPRLSIPDLLKNDSGAYFYSFAVQTGYLTYEVESVKGTEIIYKVFIPNLELQSVWRDFIMLNIVRESDTLLGDIFDNITDTDAFSKNLKEFIDYQLSYFDLDNELEKTYHVFIFGMVLALGYKCNSNRESGLGRYDLFVESNSFRAIIEFKRSDSENGLESKADEALLQIENNKYFAEIQKDLPLYKIGIGCYKKKCFVRTITV